MELLLPCTFETTINLFVSDYPTTIDQFCDQILVLDRCSANLTSQAPFLNSLVLLKVVSKFDFKLQLVFIDELCIEFNCPWSIIWITYLLFPFHYQLLF
jgi:hypothetical protein